MALRERGDLLAITAHPGNLVCQARAGKQEKGVKQVLRATLDPLEHLDLVDSLVAVDSPDLRVTRVLRVTLEQLAPWVLRETREVSESQDQQALQDAQDLQACSEEWDRLVPKETWALKDQLVSLGQREDQDHAVTAGLQAQSDLQAWMAIRVIAAKRVRSDRREIMVHRDRPDHRDLWDSRDRRDLLDRPVNPEREACKVPLAARAQRVHVACSAPQA